MSFFKQQLNLFFLALGFFSRIPMPAWVAYSPELLNRASRYFTLVGWLLGALVALVFAAANSFFSQPISIWLAMLFSLLLTGAFHEDGLADTADGLGGGFTREKKLAIMKDSRIGTYGASALVMALLGKFLLLSECADIPWALLLAYSLSRALSGSLIFDMAYVSDSDASKSKPLANNQSRTDLIVLLASALPAFLFFPPITGLSLLSACVLLRLLAKRYLQQQLGGYTGDTLGAVQQLVELVIYLVIIAGQQP